MLFLTAGLHTNCCETQSVQIKTNSDNNVIQRANYIIIRLIKSFENRRKFISVLDEAITESISYDSPLGLFCAAVLDDLTDNLGST